MSQIFSSYILIKILYDFLKCGTYTRSLTNPHKKESKGVRSGERGGHAIGATPTNPPTWETVVEVLAHFSEVMRRCTVLLEVNASFLVIFVTLRNEELLENVQIHDAGNGLLHEKEGAVHFIFAEGSKHVNISIVTNMFQEGTWIFTTPSPAVVGVDLTSEMERVFVTEIY
ncbi:hypothetical protein L798_11008 [Zootermopsis nevadensis]|uniref:Uncharacterized protein n=1 Tax=Zootermopsis nevadensis TaxID=136037 RepID=A0A067R8W7_ZOONE|nr:hypothetical protein L798_11008 [Zootermopsis nevadensis]